MNSVMIGLLALALFGWGISYPVKDELRLRQLQQENQKTEPFVEALRREDTQLQTLRKEVQFLSDIDRRKGEVLRVLDAEAAVALAVAAALVRRGYAQVMTVPPNVRHQDLFLKLQRDARDAGHLRNRDRPLESGQGDRWYGATQCNGAIDDHRQGGTD